MNTCNSMEENNTNSSRENDVSCSRQAMMRMLVESIHHITSKCNISYTLLIIVCITATLALYNEYASFSQRFVKLSHLAHNETVQNLILKNRESICPHADSLQTQQYISNSEIAEQLLNNYVQHFVDTQFFTFPIIGVTISTADVSTFLSLAILVITAWCYVCIRSENFATGKVLNMTQGYPLQYRKYIFYSICFHNIFFPTTFRNKPYSNLSDKKSNASLEYTLKSNKKKNDDYNTPLNRTTRRGFIATLLFLLPIIIAGSNVIVMLHESFDIFPTDRYIVYDDTDCVLIYSDTPEKYVDKFTDKQKLFVQLSKPFRMDTDSELYQRNEHLIKYVTAIRLVTVLSTVLSILIISFCVHCIKYLKSTNNIMFDYKSAIKCEEEFEMLCKKIPEGIDRITKAEVVRFVSSPKKKDPYKNMIFGFTVFAPNNLEKLKNNISKLELADKPPKYAEWKKQIYELIQSDDIIEPRDEWYCIIFEIRPSCNTDHTPQRSIHDDVMRHQSTQKVKTRAHTAFSSLVAAVLQRLQYYIGTNHARSKR